MEGRRSQGRITRRAAAVDLAGKRDRRPLPLDRRFDRFPPTRANAPMIVRRVAMPRRRRPHPLQGSAPTEDTRCQLSVPRSLVVTALVVAALSTFAAAASASNPDAGRTRVASLESSVLREINALRRTHGRAPLRLSANLSAAAAAHSRSMGTRGFFEHASADGTPFWRRIERHYGRRGFSHWSVGENLLWASPGLAPADAVKRWLASPPHRANLLDRRWREVGLGAVQVPAAPGTFEGLDVTILTADFGFRR